MGFVDESGGAAPGTFATPADIAALQAQIDGLDPFDASFTPLIISGNAPAVDVIPPEIEALDTDDEENGDKAWARFDDYDIFYEFDGTEWNETGRAMRATGESISDITRQLRTWTRGSNGGAVAAIVEDATDFVGVPLAVLADPEQSTTWKFYTKLETIAAGETRQVRILWRLEPNAVSQAALRFNRTNGALDIVFNKVTGDIVHRSPGHSQTISSRTLTNGLQETIIRFTATAAMLGYQLYPAYSPNGSDVPVATLGGTWQIALLNTVWTDSLPDVNRARWEVTARNTGGQPGGDGIFPFQSVRLNQTHSSRLVAYNDNGSWTVTTGIHPVQVILNAHTTGATGVAERVSYIKETGAPNGTRLENSSDGVFGEAVPDVQATAIIPPNTTITVEGRSVSSGNNQALEVGASMEFIELIEINPEVPKADDLIQFEQTRVPLFAAFGHEGQGGTFMDCSYIPCGDESRAVPMTYNPDALGHNTVINDTIPGRINLGGGVNGNWNRYAESCDALFNLGDRLRAVVPDTGQFDAQVIVFTSELPGQFPANTIRGFVHLEFTNANHHIRDINYRRVYTGASSTGTFEAERTLTGLDFYRNGVRFFSYDLHPKPTEKTLLLRQDLSAGPDAFFAAAATHEFLDFPAATPKSAIKFSAMGQLENFRRADGTLRFELRFSDHVAAPVGTPDEIIDLLEQTSNPMGVGAEVVQGFNLIETNSPYAAFRGIALASAGATIFDGTAGTDWWRAIGVTSPGFGGVIPTQESPAQITSNVVELYAIPDEPATLDGLQQQIAEIPDPSVAAFAVDGVPVDAAPPWEGPAVSIANGATQVVPTGVNLNDVKEVRVTFGRSNATWGKITVPFDPAEIDLNIPQGKLLPHFGDTYLSISNMTAAQLASGDIPFRSVTASNAFGFEISKIEFKKRAVVEDGRELIFTQAAAASGSSNNLDAKTWQEVVDRYESIVVNLRIANLGYTHEIDTSRIVDGGTIVGPLNATLHFALNSTDFADGQFGFSTTNNAQPAQELEIWGVLPHGRVSTLPTSAQIVADNSEHLTGRIVNGKPEWEALFDYPLADHATSQTLIIPLSNFAGTIDKLLSLDGMSVNSLGQPYRGISGNGQDDHDHEDFQINFTTGQLAHTYEGDWSGFTMRLTARYIKQ